MFILAYGEIVFSWVTEEMSDQLYQSLGYTWETLKRKKHKEKERKPFQRFDEQQI